ASASGRTASAPASPRPQTTCRVAAALRLMTRATSPAPTRTPVAFAAQESPVIVPSVPRSLRILHASSIASALRCSIETTPQHDPPHGSEPAPNPGLLGDPGVLEALDRQTMHRTTRLPPRRPFFQEETGFRNSLGDPPSSTARPPVRRPSRLTGEVAPSMRVA